MIILKKEVMIVLFIILIILLSLGTHSSILINEILANGVSEPDSEWVELFNNQSFGINLINFNISETSSKNITLNVTIPANGFIVLVENFTLFNAIFPNVNQSGIKIIEYGEIVPSFELANTKGIVIFYNSSGAKIDTIEYVQSSAQENISIGRYPDGSSALFNLSTLTPGAKNDKEAPKSNKWINPPNNNTAISGLVNVTLNITDDTTEVNSTMINFNGTNFSMLKNGDIWTFLWNTRFNLQKSYNITVFFNDSYGKSNKDILFNVSLDNAYNPPNLTSVNLTNTDLLNRTNGTLQAFWSFSDVDNDTITANETLWYINNTLMANYANKTHIHQINTTKLENWTFSVRVFDGFNWSGFANSSTIKILNAKPSLNISTTSIILSETQKVNVSLSASDLDNDFLNYTINDSRFFREGDYFIWNTNLSDAGIYKVNITANDSAEIDYLLINITINDARDLDNDGNPDFNESDDDNDNILDENDFLTGNSSSINTALPLSIAINGTSNLSKLFNGTYTINITNGTDTIIEFNFTFNPSSILDFGNLTINRTTKGSSAISIRGLRLFSTKTFFLERINTNVKSICIKDADASFDTISPGCDTESETLLICNNSTSLQYACFDTGTKYKVIGLNHSAVKEQCRDVDGDGYGTGCSAGTDCNDNDAGKTTDCSSPSSTSSSGSSSGGGGGVICISNWQCEEWSKCIDGFKNRKCFDTNQCAFPTKKPEVTQECAEEIKVHIVSVSKQIEKANATIKRVTKSTTQKDLPITTGRVITSIESKNKNLGIFIIFLEAFIIVGAYIAVKNKFY